ncbi:MAG: hypothetical protein GYA55_13970 [SAR324 cluster bacterium]|uniref:Uncharacterized protein n=1 Tax=SAR324 cluster bacterium TaxID=2024889 RepID=A0A7X9FTY1_9DELT|nr:hypothetical protein [SAR324 cluster bacterium]
MSGKRASLILEDTESSNIGTINAIHKLSAVDGARIILGPSWIGNF